MTKEYKTLERQKKNNPSVRALPDDDTLGVGASHMMSDHRILANNLMDSLPRQIKLICDLAKRLSAAVEFHDSDIPVRVSGRTRTQRPPLPSTQRFKRSDARGGELPFPSALTKISNPRAKRDFHFADKLSVDGRDSEVAFPLAETIECFKGQFKPRDVVHVKDNSKQVRSARNNSLVF